MSNEVENTGQTDAKSEVEIQRRDNELRRERLDDREASLNRWLWFVGIAISINVAGFGYIVFEIENRGKTDQIVRGVDAESVAAHPEKADQAAESIREDPEASLITKAIARTVSLQKLDKRDEAIEMWRAVALIAEESDKGISARAWFSIGYLSRDKALDDSIAAFNQAIRLKPDYADAYNNRGVAKLKLERFKESIADFDEAIRLKPDYADAYNNRAAARLNLGHYRKSIADFDEATRLKPDYAGAYRNRGTAHRQLESYEAAIADYGEAIRLRPDHADTYVDRAIAKLQSGDKNGARQDYETALRIARKSSNTKLEAQVEQSLRTLNDSSTSYTER